jgi:hypothetical protein
VTWSIPNAGYQLRLVRNSFSVPADQTDGFDLAQAAYTSAPYFMDTVTNAGGMWLYYSQFMLTSTPGYWQRAGDAQVMLPNNWGYGARMFAMMPIYYQNMDNDMDDPIFTAPLSSPTWSSLEGLTWARLSGTGQ